MTDNPGSTPPFPGFPGFPPAEMLDRMWGMMRLTPFGAAFPGTSPASAQGFVPSLSMMSDMMAPLTNVEELDKRITDMRAVEQWLKLNLNMLQSAIQALEVQRATRVREMHQRMCLVSCHRFHRQRMDHPKWCNHRHGQYIH